MQQPTLDDVVCLICGGMGLHAHTVTTMKEAGMGRPDRGLDRLSDSEVVVLYREWSENEYHAGFMTPDEHFVREFIEWLRAEREKGQSALTRYEVDMVAMFRKLIAETAA